VTDVTAFKARKGKKVSEQEITKKKKGELRKRPIGKRDCGRHSSQRKAGILFNRRVSGRMLEKEGASAYFFKGAKGGTSERFVGKGKRKPVDLEKIVSRHSSSEIERKREVLNPSEKRAVARLASLP